MISILKTLPLSSQGVYTVDKDALGYIVTKFDSLLNVENIYRVGEVRGGALSCDCPANKWNKCKHRSIIIIFETERRVNKRWFLDHETLKWYLPIRRG